MWLLDQAEVHVAGSARRRRHGRHRRRLRRGPPRPLHAARARREAGAPGPDHRGRRGDGLPASRIATSPTSIELRGNARITGGEGMGALRGDAGARHQPRLRRGRPHRRSTPRWPARAASPWPARRPAQSASGWRRSSSTSRLGPDGAVTSLSSRERVVVTLPATAERAGPHHQVGRADGAGAAGAGLTSMKFDQQVEFTRRRHRQDAADPHRPRPHPHAGPGRGRRARSRHLHRRGAVRGRRRCAPPPPRPATWSPTTGWC